MVGSMRYMVINEDIVETPVAFRNLVARLKSLHMERRYITMLP